MRAYSHQVRGAARKAETGSERGRRLVYRERRLTLTSFANGVGRGSRVIAGCSGGEKTADPSPVCVPGNDGLDVPDAAFAAAMSCSFLRNSLLRRIDGDPDKPVSGDENCVAGVSVSCTG